MLLSRPILLNTVLNHCYPVLSHAAVKSYPLKSYPYSRSFVGYPLASLLALCLFFLKQYAHTCMATSRAQSCRYSKSRLNGQLSSLEDVTTLLVTVSIHIHTRCSYYNIYIYRVMPAFSIICNYACCSVVF